MIIEGLGFRGGSDEKMRRMCLGREIVVAGLPPLVNLSIKQDVQVTFTEKPQIKNKQLKETKT